MTQIVKQQNAQLAYRDNEEVTQLAQIVKKVAPWANGMADGEIGLTVRRAMALGVDPLNPHEVQIWKDWNGTINIQLSYSLIIEWVKRFKGEHTRPVYYRLTPEQLDEEGLALDDIAYRVKFIMTEDLFKITEHSEAFGGDAAREMFTVEGLGSCSRDDWDRKSKKGNDIFAPNGRSKAWKVQKRALADAYRNKFGDPTEAEIVQLRRDLGYYSAEPPDWDGAEGLPTTEAHALASGRAKQTHYAEEHPATREEMDDAKAALFGGPPVVAPVDAEWSDEADAESIAELQAEADAGERGTPATRSVMAEAPGDLPVKWPAFCKLAKEALGYDNIPHVQGALHKIKGDDYEIFHTSGDDAGKLVDDPATVWGWLAEYKAQA